MAEAERRSRNRQRHAGVNFLKRNKVWREKSKPLKEDIMGLDAWFQTGKGKEIAYFRKHADLHGFLQEIWLEKNPGKDPSDFNCKKLRITKKILKQLEDLARNQPDKHYHGFFWGATRPDDWKDTLDAVDKMRGLISRGEQVYYTSWW